MDTGCEDVDDEIGLGAGGWSNYKALGQRRCWGRESARIRSDWRPIECLTVNHLDSKFTELMINEEDTLRTS